MKTYYTTVVLPALTLSTLYVLYRPEALFYAIALNAVVLIWVYLKWTPEEPDMRKLSPREIAVLKAEWIPIVAVFPVAVITYQFQADQYEKVTSHGVGFRTKAETLMRQILEVSPTSDLKQVEDMFGLKILNIERKKSGDSGLIILGK